MKDPETNHQQADGAARLAVVEVESHLEETPFDLDRLIRLANAALPLCLEAALEGSALGLLDEIEVAVVDDQTIGRVHDEYLNDPTPTDVITFDHGEIVISFDTALREAGQRGLPVLRELLLYLVHGLLHLGGHDDRDTGSRQRMSALQEGIVHAIYDDLSAASHECTGLK